MKIQPLHQVNYRPPIMGRLRFGEKVGDKKRPKATTEWIFSSNNRQALEQVAEKYGGEIVPFDGAQDEWKVKTNANRIRVMLPPEPLGDAVFERWDGGGLRRRCDTVTCTGFPKNGTPRDVPCICIPEQDEVESQGGSVDDPQLSRKWCKPKTRLSVIIPELPLGGVWLMSSGGMNAFREIRASVNMIQAVSTRSSFTDAELSLEQRKGQDGKLFVVPVLGLTGSFDEISGDIETGAKMPALTAPVEIIAELVEGDDEWK